MLDQSQYSEPFQNTTYFLRISSCKMGLQGSIAETGDLIFATQNRQHESQVIGLGKVYSPIRPLFVVFYRTGNLAKVGSFATVVSMRSTHACLSYILIEVLLGLCLMRAPSISV